MKYQIGDKIIVLHSDEEGKVVEVINDKMVLIEVRGVKFPAYMDQIDFPYFKMFTQKKPVEKKKIHIDNLRKEKQTSRKKVADGVFLNIVPVFDKDVFDDEVVQKVKIYLVNHNEEDYDFKYTFSNAGEELFGLESNLRGLSDFYCNDIDFEIISDSPVFDFEFSLTNPDKKKAPFYERSIKLRSKQFFKKIEEIQLKNEPSFSLEIFLQYPDKTEEPKIDLSKLGNAGFKVYDAKNIRQHLPPARSVIDLHIEKLADNHKHLSVAEILTLQLTTFEKYYELAVLHHLASFIVVHGIGEGVLRDQIHEQLRHKAEVKSFVNQYHHLYGYGATEIYFKKFS